MPILCSLVLISETEPFNDILLLVAVKLIYDLKSSNPAARVSVKLVSENGVGVVASGTESIHTQVRPQVLTVFTPK
jgi:glutamate synthase domain-containing protein 2